MKKNHLFVILISCLCSTVHAQKDPEDIISKEAKKYRSRFGLRVGYNIAKLNGDAPNFSPKAQNGFNAAAFFSSGANGLGYRTELIFSRQGFSFSGDGKVQNVQQDYIFMPHLTTFTIAQKVQLQAGGQMGYLLNASKDSTTSSEQDEQLMQYMNRIDYGATVGIEIYPFKGLIIGARYNISMGNPLKNPETPPSSPSIPLPLPVNPGDFKGKNAVIQFSVGYRF